MMKIVVAIDSLKGSLTSIQAGEAIEKGIKKSRFRSRSSHKTSCRWWRRMLRNAQTAMGKAPNRSSENLRKEILGKLVVGILRGQ